ncbi:Uncharacterized conserved protein [Plasmopara halstedii]|uniref:Uncharacterized conserved protein n=1 Tax=Plasmopara halstedii TaxID=4781 RepID=A0A0P1ARI7_PLAHL|nr:Uncharacterized conserved protein [Plasmopara halstedii]CEG44000.1 Uncharacterized conserved protein [Plasmopara halstedii]|eukprot:XP_024580369.1 Uncharacterized conserved protein [Plasmopara halstedii]
MVTTKPSKKQRGKLKVSVAKAKAHVKFDDNGNQVLQKKRMRVAKTKKLDKVKEGGGKSDRSPEMIQQAKYYLEQWQKRDEPKAADELPWKFKTIKQQWILRWMYEADVVPKAMFAIVLKYLNGIQGAARKRVLDSAQDIIDTGAPGEEGDKMAGNETVLSIKLARRRYKRALQIAELLA